MAITLRPAQAGDAPFLWRCLALAAQARPEETWTNPGLAKHLAGWQRSDDFGLVAEADGMALGATWARHHSPDEAPCVYVDEHTPEIVLAVLPEARARGVGSALLRALIEAASRRDDCAALCLAVRVDNPARRLYERAGFRALGVAYRNRAGGLSLPMIRALRE